MLIIYIIGNENLVSALMRVEDEKKIDVTNSEAGTYLETSYNVGKKTKVMRMMMN